VVTMGSGMSPWYAAFLMRSHGMAAQELGVWLGIIFGGGGVAGILLGGYVSARWLPDSEQGQMRLCALMNAALMPLFALFLLLPEKHQALLSLVPLVAVSIFFIGPTFALLQRLVAEEMRATTLAVVMLLSNLIGMGVGPQIVGLLSDLLAPALGVDSLRYAMLTMSFVAFWTAHHFWAAGRTAGEDLALVARAVAAAR
jgi:hypothetical protein